MRGEISSYSLEKRYVREDGSTLWADLSASLQRDAAGRPAYSIAILQDISERKAALEALRLATARLDLAVRGSRIGIWEVDLAGGLLREPRRFHERPGAARPRRPALRTDSRRGCRSCIPTTASGSWTASGYLAGEIRDFEVEHRVRHGDGSYHWLLTRGVAMRDEAGRPARMIGSSIDITDHKAAIDALSRSESLLAEAQRVPT